ncbi:poor-like proteinous synapsis 1 [Abeliophyllum distichum]|uniref:Poor-like proteinous synapsis 1 n=1 Tax=Abeliophyllum distichum TaxID=126358 RepID=A0ABD1R7W4_9LAMI
MLQEEHYISKLQFSWPQVSCVSGFPPRGSRAVFVSYKDGVGQIQKFAFRFLTNFEAEHFMNVLEILDSAKLQGLPCDSDLSYQADSVPSVGPAYRPEENWQYTTSADTSTHFIPPIDKAQDSNPQESSQNVADEEIPPAFPPSFTSLMMNCYPAANEAKPAETEEVDLKTQIMQYLEGSSFKDILATVENVINELGDDIML